MSEKEQPRLNVSGLDQAVLYAALCKLIDRIEQCGGSIELTHAVSYACDLRAAIGNIYNTQDSEALVRVIEGIL